MIPHSPELAATLAASHEVVSRVDLWYAGRLVAAGLPLVDGQVQQDADDDIRARLTCTIACPTGELVPDGANGLTPFGGELHVQRGVRVPGGAVELVSLGWFRIQQTDAEEAYRRNRAGAWVSGGASIEVEALDRMSAVDDSRLLAAGKPPRGATCLSEIRRLVRGLLPVSTFDIDDEPVPAGLVYEESRLEAVAALADAVEAKAYAGPDGTLTMTNVAPVDPVWTFAGTEAGGLLAVSQVASRDGAYNAVVARGEADGDKPAVQAVAYDVTPNSPTRWDGPYGRVPTFYSSPLIKSVKQAQRAAKTRMDSLVRGRERLYRIEAVPVPFLQPLDSVTVSTPRVRFTGQLVSIDMPLTAEGGAAVYTVRALESGITVLDPSEGAPDAA